MKVRKLFIFYNYKKQITCVGADDGQTLGSGFVDSTPVNRGRVRIGISQGMLLKIGRASCSIP